MATKNNLPVPQSERTSVQHRPTAALPTAEFSEPPPLETAERLIWALLDDQISSAQCNQLARLILDHVQVRQRYLECIQLHIDLHSMHGQGARAPVDPPKPPVLSSLNISYPVISPNTDIA